MKKRVLSLALALVLWAGLACPASAAVPVETPEVATSLAQVRIYPPEEEENRVLDYVFVIDRQGVLWQYKSELHQSEAPIAGFQKSKIAENVVHIGQHEDGVGILKADGTLFYLHLYGEEKLYEAASGVVSVKGRRYLTQQGDLWQYYWSEGNGQSINQEEHKVGLKTRKVDSNVISHTWNTAYVTSDHAVHIFFTESTQETIESKCAARSIVQGYSGNYPVYFVISETGELYGWGNNANGYVGNGGFYQEYVYYGWGDTKLGIPLSYVLHVKKMDHILDNVEDVWISDAVYAVDKDGNCWTWGDPNQTATLTAYDKPPAKYDTTKVERGVTLYGVNSNFPTGKPYASPRKMKDGEQVRLLADYRQGSDGTIYASIYGKEYALPHAGGVLGGDLNYAVGSASSGQLSSGFFDVPENAYFAPAVQWAVEQKITTGTSAVAFSPEQTCTRAQILTFLWRANGCPEPASSDGFQDVSSKDYYEKAALWAKEKGLEQGDSFGGDTPCTRAATVTYLWKLAGSPAAGQSKFADVPAGADYAQAVSWAVEQGVTSGTSETAFSPDQTCTRGQIVTFLHRDLAE